MVEFISGLLTGGFVMVVILAAMVASTDKKAPARKRARWIVETSKGGTDFTCSNCGYSFTDTDGISVPQDTYCRKCGAEMVILDE